MNVSLQKVKRAQAENVISSSRQFYRFLNQILEMDMSRPSRLSTTDRVKCSKRVIDLIQLCKH